MASARISQISKPDDPDELDVVSLREPFTTEHGVLPRGACGTVVMIWKDGQEYGVEFTKPFAALVDLHRSQIDLLATR